VIRRDTWLTAVQQEPHCHNVLLSKSWRFPWQGRRRLVGLLGISPTFNTVRLCLAWTFYNFVRRVILHM